MSLEEGVGLSLVNKVPEELLFATLSGIDMHFTRTAASEVLELTVRDIQVHNSKNKDTTIRFVIKSQYFAHQQNQTYTPKNHHIPFLTDVSLFSHLS